MATSFDKDTLLKMASNDPTAFEAINWTGVSEQLLTELFPYVPGMGTLHPIAFYTSSTIQVRMWKGFPQSAQETFITFTNTLAAESNNVAGEIIIQRMENNIEKKTEGEEGTKTKECKSNANMVKDPSQSKLPNFVYSGSDKAPYSVSRLLVEVGIGNVSCFDNCTSIDQEFKVIKKSYMKKTLKEHPVSGHVSCIS